MSATYELFSAWKAKKGLNSDNQGALALGVTRMAASAWKNGRNAEVPLIIKMAKEIGENEQAWTLQVLAERSTGEERRAIEKMARQLLVGRPGLEPGTNRLKVAGRHLRHAFSRLNAAQYLIDGRRVLRVLRGRKVRVAPHHLFA